MLVGEWLQQEDVEVSIELDWVVVDAQNLYESIRVKSIAFPANGKSKVLARKIVNDWFVMLNRNVRNRKALSVHKIRKRNRKKRTAKKKYLDHLFSKRILCILFTHLNKE